MKNISQSWKRFLLNEVMKNPSDLPYDVYVTVDVTEEESVVVKYSDEDGNKLTHGPVRGVVHVDQGEPVVGNCLGAWVIYYSEASQGWGPLLYDVALEWVSMRGTGITPDRSGVSDAAYGVWLKYMNDRDDVETVQLDNLKNDLTSTKKDNCLQRSSEDHAEKKGIGWNDTATSKMYIKKDNNRIRALKDMDKLIVKEDEFV